MSKSKKRRARSKYVSPANVMSHCLSHDDGVYDWVPIRLPERPTKTQPGTPERVAVLAYRAAVGEHLWHPDDLINQRESFGEVWTMIMRDDETMLGEKQWPT